MKKDELLEGLKELRVIIREALNKEGEKIDANVTDNITAYRMLTNLETREIKIDDAIHEIENLVEIYLKE